MSGWDSGLESGYHKTHDSAQSKLYRECFWARFTGPGSQRASQGNHTQGSCGGIFIWRSKQEMGCSLAGKDICLILCFGVLRSSFWPQQVHRSPLAVGPDRDRLSVEISGPGCISHPLLTPLQTILHPPRLGLLFIIATNFKI